jgi:hypothetical protein
MLVRILRTARADCTCFITLVVPAYQLSPSINNVMGHLTLVFLQQG